MQNVMFLILATVLLLFIWGKIRYDLVALSALFAVAVLRVVPADEIFVGFGHPAVITVAAVMIISKGLQNSGLIDVIARWVIKMGKTQVSMILLLCTITAFASAFMNNVGALAIMMPVAIQASGKNGTPPSFVLMPLAFSSLVGGMITMIGTPPNIIIATFRADANSNPFKMFDFLPVGLPITIVSVLFISLLGWRLLPKRKGQSGAADLFRIDEYITEVKVLKDAKMNGKTVTDIRSIEGVDISVLGLIRNKRRIHVPNQYEQLTTDDIIILEADPENLKSFVDVTGFDLLGGKKFRKDAIGSKDISIREVIVSKDSKLTGKTAAGINMRSRYGINLLAVARSNVRLIKRLDQVKFRVGDVLLLQGRTHLLDDTITNIGCIPLAERGLRIGYKKRILLASSIFLAAIITVVMGLFSAPVAFSIAALLYVLTNVISFREVYSVVDWSVIVLLAAMIPIGSAFETSGSAEMIAKSILSIGSTFPLWLILSVLMVITMILSNIMNNAATAVLMAPIAIIIANNVGTSVDVFLMTIALAASSPFLTPIGHQSNTLVLGPGGYKFSDYWRMGLPLQIFVIIIGIPLIIWIWG